MLGLRDWKSNLIKLVVALITLAFLFEVFAFYRGTPQSVYEPTTPTTQTGDNASAVFFKINATLEKYSDVLILRGDISDAARAKARELERSGVVLFSNEITQNELALNLAPEANITALASEFGGFGGITASARATLLGPDTVYVESQGFKGNVTLAARFTMDLDPGIEAGENVTIALRAMLDNGRITQIAPMLAPSTKRISTEVTIANLTGDYLAGASIPWEGRNLDLSAVNGELGKNLTNVQIVRYDLNSLVNVSLGNATNETLGEIKNLYYVRELRDDGILVNDSFTDESQVLADLRALLGNETNATFADSLLVLRFNSEKPPQEELRAVLNQTSLDLYASAIVKVNDTITDELNKTYSVQSTQAPMYVPAIYAQFGLEVLQNTTLPVDIDAQALGRKITSYTVVQQ